jgi:hypothetical protein
MLRVTVPCSSGQGPRPSLREVGFPTKAVDPAGGLAVVAAAGPGRSLACLLTGREPSERRAQGEPQAFLRFSLERAESDRRASAAVPPASTLASTAGPLHCHVPLLPP